MKTLFASLSFLTAFSASAAGNAADLDCSAFLTGQWAGRGEVEMFGMKNEVDNVYTFNTDGSFRTVNRYRSEGGDWQEQDVSGDWTVAGGTDAESCDVTLKTSGGGMTASTTSTYTRIDDDRFSTMDFEMERVEGASR